MGGKGSGGFREKAGNKKGSGVPFRERKYRIPTLYLTECTQEIKETLKRYREKCKTEQSQ